MQKKEHEFCLRCGRRLKNPQARMIGYGSVCLSKMSTEKSRRLFVSDRSVAVVSGSEV